MLNNRENIKDCDMWENIISDVIHQELMPNKCGSWFLCCYLYIQETITHCMPDFNSFLQAFYNVFVDIVNNQELLLIDAIVSSFSQYYHQDIE